MASLANVVRFRERFGSPSDKTAPLPDLIHRLANGRRMVLASNRGPVEYTREDGKLIGRRGSGGVVSVLTSVAQTAPLTWIACPMSDGDREVAASADACLLPATPDERLALKFVEVSQDAYDRYYNVFANPLLWFLQHYMWDMVHAPNINAAVYEAWEDGYRAVNRAFAESIAEEVRGAGERPVVLLQDYHLYMTAGTLRMLAPQALIQHYVHIPWPAPRYWVLLPAAMRDSILMSLCSNDIVGFQSVRDAHNFISTCEYLLEDAHVDYNKATVRWRDRTVRVRSYPVSIDVSAVLATAASPEADETRARLAPLRSEHTIVRVDRLEPSKNIARGFQAYDGLLSRYPELAGRVKFWAFLVPSRTDLHHYREYADEVFALIEEVNKRHGNDAWKPIEVFYENNYVQAIAAMTQYDVLLVNGLVDGMNLVAKEGVTVNQRDGVLVLSEGVGAYEQLGRHALTISPADIEGTIRALHHALTMPGAERKERAQQLKDAVAREDIDRWVSQQFQDLLELL